MVFFLMRFVFLGKRRRRGDIVPPEDCCDVELHSGRQARLAGRVQESGMACPLLCMSTLRPTHIPNMLLHLRLPRGFSSFSIHRLARICPTSVYETPWLKPVLSERSS